MVAQWRFRRCRHCQRLIHANILVGCRYTIPTSNTTSPIAARYFQISRRPGSQLVSPFIVTSPILMAGVGVGANVAFGRVEQVHGKPPDGLSARLNLVDPQFAGVAERGLARPGRGTRSSRPPGVRTCRRSAGRRLQRHGRARPNAARLQRVAAAAQVVRADSARTPGKLGRIIQFVPMNRFGLAAGLGRLVEDDKPQHDVLEGVARGQGQQRAGVGIDQHAAAARRLPAASPRPPARRPGRSIAAADGPSRRR